MSPRFSIALAASLALVTVAACSGTTSTPVPPASAIPVAHGPVPTAVAAPGQPAAPVPTSTPIIGGVDGDAGGPELTIETLDADTVVATLSDPEAKAWRLVVSGTGELGGERWEIVVETGDTGPVITATEIRGGQVADVLDLTGFYDGTAAAGGCHSSLPVCLDSDGFRVPEGDGLFAVRLDLPEARVPLVIRGGAATWDGEPFVLGPWHDTEAFTWGEG